MTSSTNHSSSLRVLALRLAPGDDLRQALVATVERQGIGAACLLGAAGSLSRANLRFADQSEGTDIAGPLELLSLSGTLGKGGCHLHAAVADARGEVSGGHVLQGCRVRTTAEIVIAELPGLAFERAFDAETGYRELVITPKNNPGDPA